MRDWWGSDLRWVNSDWWRDWLLWSAAAIATVAVLLQLRQDASWWNYVLAWIVYAAAATAVLGFGREVVRGFREPR